MKRLYLPLVFLLAVFTLTGCQHHDKKEIKTCIKTEFSLLCSDDDEVIASIFSDSFLLENLDKETLPPEIIDVFQLFFENFEYKIKSIRFDNDNSQAAVVLHLKTIDAKTLAKDFTAHTIIKQLQNQAAPSRVEYSLEDYYLSLQEQLTQNEYQMTETEYTISFVKENDIWSMVHDSNLADALTGGFITCSADPDLFTPEEIVALHFDTIQSFDTEQLNQFLSLNHLFSDDDEHKYILTKALAEQIQKYLDYEIIDSQNDGIHAAVDVNVTSCDWNSIIHSYSSKVMEYTATSQALADGMSARLAKAQEILLSCINSNTASTTTKVSLELINDGTNWKLQMNDALAQALLGDIDEAIANIATETDLS